MKAFKTLLAIICLLLCTQTAQAQNHVFSPSIENNPTTVNGCHDIVYLVLYCQISTTVPYNIQVVLPSGVTPLPAASSLQVQQGSTPVTVPIAGSGTTPTFSGTTLKYTMVANFQGGANYQIKVPLVLGCGAPAANGNITSGVYVTSNSALLVAGQNLSLPTINTPTVTMTQLGGSVYNAVAGETNINKTFTITAGTASLYDLTLTLPATISAAQPAVLTYTVNNTPHTRTYTSGGIKYINIQTDFQVTNPMAPGETITMLVGPYTAPAVCTTLTEIFKAQVRCNAGITTPPGVAASDCGATAANTVTSSILVNSLDRKLAYTLTIMQGTTNVTATGIKPCSTPFKLTYVISNTRQGTDINTELRKTYQSFSVQLDNEWVKTVAPPLTISYSVQNGPVQTITNPTITNGLISFNFPANTTNIGNENITVTIDGLTVAQTPQGYTGPPCTPPTGEKTLDVPTVTYLTNCGTQVIWAGPTAIAYSNLAGLIPDTYAEVNGVPGGDVTPNQYPILYFNWNQTVLNGNPWTSFKTTAPIKPFFACATTTYEAHVKIDNPVSTPGLVTLVANPVFYLHYSDEQGSVNPIPLIPQTDGSFIAQLPRYGNNVVVWVQEKLGSCPANHPGATVSTYLDLVAVCHNAGCGDYKYCFAHLTNTLNVHCPGVCNGTGIGTTSMQINNLDAMGVRSAYSCDLVQFHVAGHGYTGYPNGPQPANTQKIYLKLSYPALIVNGQPQPMFDISGATASYTYPGLNGNTTIPAADITGPTFVPGTPLGTYTIEVAITNQADCQAIRAYSNPFSMDFAIPVRCDLPYDALQGQGNYNLNGMFAQFEYTVTNNNSINYSCDGITSDFSIIAHELTSTAQFPTLVDGDNPCGQVLTIKDAEKYGGVVNEMPGYVRPLIEWPADGIDANAIAITYPDNMTLTGVLYEDATGIAPSGTVPVFSATPVVNGNMRTTYVYGFTNGNAYSWPAYTKSTVEFFRQLKVTFNQGACTPQTVSVSLPHRTRDKLANSGCSTGSNCLPWVTVPISATTSIPNTLIALNRADLVTPTPASTINPLLSTNITLPYLLDNPSGVSHVYVRPTVLNTPTNAPSGLISMGLNGNNTTLTPGTYYDYYSLTNSSANVDINMSLAGAGCHTQTLTLDVGFNCDGISPNNQGAFCGSNSATKVAITVKAPTITLTTTNGSAPRVFNNCKGVCCGDELTWAMQIANAASTGPAYNPKLKLESMGPGVIHIASIQLEYIKTGSPATTTTLPPITYSPLTTSSPVIDLSMLPLWGNTNDGFYLAANDKINVTVKLMGDGNNCSFDAQLAAKFDYQTVCQTLPVSTITKYEQFYFNTNVCGATAAAVCSTGVCQPANTWQACSPCAYGSPMNLTATVVQPGCTAGSNNGSITLIASGGPATFNPQTGAMTFPAYTFDWGSGPTTNASRTGLSAATYTVTVLDYGCSTTATFDLTNSGLTTSAAITPVTCLGGNNGAINLTVSGGTGYTYLWSPGNAITQDLTNLTAGTYSCLIQASPVGTCTPSVNVNYSVTQPATGISLTTTSTNIGCNGNQGTVGVSSITNYTSPATYSWSPGPIAGQNVSVPGANTYTVLVTDNKNCTATATATVSQLTTGVPTPVSPPYAANVCAGNNVLLNFTAADYAGDVCDVAYTINTMQGNIIQSTTPGTAQITFDAAGHGTLILNNLPAATYTVNINSITVGTCVTTLSNVVSAVFVVKPLPALTTTPVAPTPPATTIHVCGSQNNVTLTGAGISSVTNLLDVTNANYRWYSPASTTGTAARAINVNANTSVSGVYKVVYTDPGTGCSSFKELDFTFHNLQVTVTPPLTYVCATTGNSVVLTANVTNSVTPTQSYTYTWTGGGSTSSNTRTYTNTGGAYNVAVFDGLCTKSGTASIQLSPTSLSLNPSNTTVCPGGIAAFYAQPAPAGSSFTNYTWGGVNTGLDNQVYTINTPYTVTVTGRDQYNCLRTATANVTIYQPTVTASSTPGSTCLGGTATAVGANGSGSFLYNWSNGAITATATNLSQGSYTVTATDVSGCSASTSVFVTSPGSAISIALNTASVSCNSNYVSITSTVTGGNGNYSYAWSDGSIGSSIPYADASQGNTVYTLTVTDGNCCSASAFVSVNSTLNLGVTLIPENSVCGIAAGNSAQTGRVINIAQGGASPMTFAWSNQATTQNIQHVTAGIYSITVTDANGCTASAVTGVSDGNADFTAADPLPVNPSLVNCSATNTLPAVTATGAWTPFSYDWALANTAITYSNQPDFAPGVYTLVITGSNNCKLAKIIPIVPVLPSAALIATPETCFGSGDGTVAAVQTGANINYNWGSYGNTNAITGLSAGAYPVVITNSVTGCSVATSINVNSPQQLTATASLTSNACAVTGSATVVVTGGYPCYTYLWNNMQTGVTANILAAGTATVQVTDALGCTINASVNIPLALSITTQQSNATCSGANGNISVTSTGGAAPITYTWSNNPGVPTALSNISVAAGNYSVTVKDANNCTATASFTVTQPAALAISLNAPAELCFGATASSVTATVTGGTGAYNYVWNVNPQPNGNVVSNHGAGTYNVTVTDASGCTISGTATINQPSALAISVTAPNELCYGQQNSSVTASATGGTGSYTYIWNVTPQPNSNVVSNPGAGTYNVTAFDVNNCSITGTATISQPAALAISVLAGDETCYGQTSVSVTATVTGGTGAYGYTWNVNPQPGSNVVSNPGAGTYNVTATDANNCTITGTATINQPTALGINVVAGDETCHGQATVSVTATVTGGTGLYTYHWNVTTQPNSNVLTTPGAGAYSVTATDASGCTISGSATINQPAAIINSITANSPSCSGATNGSITVDATGQGLNFNWNNGTYSGNPLTNLAPGNYTVVVTDAGNCSASASVTVGGAAPLQINMSSVNVNCYMDGSGSVTANVTGGTLPYSYEWAHDQLLTGNTVSAIGTYGDYYVTVTDNSGCSATATRHVYGPGWYILVGTNVINGDCQGNPNVIELGYGGGTLHMTYNWHDPNGVAGGPFTSDVQMAHLPGVIIPGTYTITLTDGHNCTVSTTATVNGPGIAVTETHTNSTCGGLDGTINLTATGGDGNYYYNWGFTSGSYITGLAADTYTATVTDGSGCTTTKTVTIGTGLGPVSTTCQSCEQLTDGTDIYNCNIIGMQFNYNGPAGSVLTVTSQQGFPIPFTMTGDPNGTLNEGLLDAGYNEVVVGLAPPNTSPATTDVLIFTVTDANGVVLCTQNVNVTLNCTPAAMFPTCTAPQIEFTTPVVTCTGVDNYTGLPTYQVELDVINNTGSNLMGGSLECNCEFDNQNNPGPYVLQGTNHVIANVGVPTANTNSITVTYVFLDDHFCAVCRNELVINLPVSNIQANPLVTNASCGNSTLGSIVLAPSGGTLPYSYQWSNNTYNSSANNLPAGNYQVIVTDANQCGKQFSYTIGNGSNLQVTETHINPICGASNGSITLTASGGDGNYHYFWGMPGGTATLSNLATGSYSATVSDNHGCNATITVTLTDAIGPLTQVCHSCQQMVTVNSNVNLFTMQFNYTGAADVTINAISQQGNFAAVLGIDDPVNGLSDVIQQGLNTMLLADIPITGGISDVITLEFTDASGVVLCTQNVPVTLDCTNDMFDACTSAQVEFSNINVACNGTDPNTGKPQYHVTMDITNHGADLIGGAIDCDCDYTDNANGPLIPSGTTSYEMDVVPYNPASTSATFQYIFLNDDLCAHCSQLLQLNLPAANLNPNQVIVDANCNNGTTGSITLSPTGGTQPYTYNWNNNPPVNTASNLIGGTYEVTLTDADNCGQAFAFNVGTSSNIQVTETHVDATCNASNGGDGSITLTAAGGDGNYSYNWGFANTATVNNLPAGDYTATVHDGHGCDATITVHISSALSQITQVCYSCQPLSTPPYVGQFYTFQFNYNGPAGLMVTVTAQNGMIAFSGIGDPSTTVSEYVQQGLNNLLVVEVPLSGQTTTDIITINFTDANGVIVCTQTMPVVINCNAASQMASCTPAEIVFSNVSIVCDGVSNNGAPTYALTFDLTNNTGANLVGGSLDCDCEYDDFNHPPVITQGTQTINAHIETQWQGQSTITFSYVFMGADMCGHCTRLTTLNLPMPAVNPNPTVVNTDCGPIGSGSISIAPTGGTSPYAFEWFNGTNGTDVTNLYSGNYSVTISDATGCGQRYDYYVGNNTNLTITETHIDPTCGTNNGSITLNVTGGSGYYYYSWSGSSTGPNTSSTLSNVGPGTYYAYVSENPGCGSSIAVTLNNAVGPVTQTCYSCQYIQSAGASAHFYTLQFNYSGPAGVTVTPTSQAGNYVMFSTTGGPNTSLTEIVSSGINNLAVIVAPGNPLATSDIITLVFTDANGVVLCSVDVPVTMNCNPANLFTTCVPAMINFNNVSVVCNGVSNDGRPQYQLTFDLQNNSGSNLLGGGIDCDCDYNDNTSGPLILQGANNMVVDIEPLLATATTATFNYVFLDANLCPLCSRQFTINLPLSAINDNAIVTDADCNAGIAGSIYLSPSGGTSPYAFHWGNNSGYDYLANLQGGSYNVTITDDQNCGKAFSYNVGNGSSIQVTETHVNPGCGANNGSITLTATGGSGSYSYNWDGTPGGATLSNLQAGTYHATVTDANGCNATITVTIAGAIGAVSQVCHSCFQNSNGNNQEFFSFQFNFSGPSGVIISTITSQQGNQVDFSTSGDPNTSLTNSVAQGINDLLLIMDPNSGSTNDVITILFRSATGAPFCTVQVPITYDCTNNQFQACGSSPFSFSNVNVTCNGIDPNSGNQQYAVAFNLINGSGTNVLGGQIDCNCDYNDNTTGPLLTTGANAIVATIVPDVANATSATATFVFLDANFCAMCTRTLTVNLPIPNINAHLTTQQAVCNTTGNAWVKPTGGVMPYTIQWSNGATGYNTTNLQPGNYSVTITDAQSCGQVYNFTINQVGLQVASNVQTSCFQANAGSIYLFPNGGVAPYNYNWAHTTVNSNNLTGLAQGMYNVTVSDMNGCSSSAIYTVHQSQPVVGGICTNYNDCNSNTDASATMFITSGSGPFAYFWSTGYTSQTINNLLPGTYSASVQDMYGCWANIGMFQISNQTNLNVTGNVTYDACPDNSGVITLNVSGGINCPAGCYNYVWNDVANSTTANLGGLADGLYTVTVSQGETCPYNGQSWYCASAVTFNVAHPSCKTDEQEQVTENEPGSESNDADNRGSLSSKVSLLKLIPNPARDVVRVQYLLIENTETDLKMFDIAGRLVSTYKLTGQRGEITISVAEFESGTYTYKAESGKGILQTGRLIIVH